MKGSARPRNVLREATAPFMCVCRADYSETTLQGHSPYP